MSFLHYVCVNIIHIFKDRKNNGKVEQSKLEVYLYGKNNCEACIKRKKVRNSLLTFDTFSGSRWATPAVTAVFMVAVSTNVHPDQEQKIP